MGRTSKAFNLAAAFENVNAAWQMAFVFAKT
jgi:hypothetical protein